MKLLRAVKGSSLREHLRNYDLRDELNIFSLSDRIKENREISKAHVGADSRHTYVYLTCKPTGKRDRGRTRKRELCELA